MRVVSQLHNRRPGQQLLTMMRLIIQSSWSMPVLPSRRAHAGYWTPLDTPQRRPCYANGLELHPRPALLWLLCVTRCGRAAEDRIYTLQLLAQGILGKNIPGKNHPGKNHPGKNHPSKNHPVITLYNSLSVVCLSQADTICEGKWS